MADIRWGILATGGIAHSFARDLRDDGRTITAVGSRSLATAQAFADEFEIPSAYGSYEDLVASDEVDIVYVASPHPFHAANAELALRAGKHVLIEKPFTLNAKEAERVVDLAAERGLLVLEAMWTRFLPHMVRIREIIASGALGRIRAVSAEHVQLLPSDPAHRINAFELGGGALLDLGIYPVSFAADVLGSPETIEAVATFRETGADTSVAAVFHYTGGEVATILTASDARGANTATIAGTIARIEIDRVWYTPTSFRVIDSEETVVESFESDIGGRGMQFQAREAERLIAEGRTESEILSPAESVEIMRILDTIRGRIGLVYPGD